MTFRRILHLLIVASLVAGFGSPSARAADKAQIQQAIAKGVTAIKANLKNLSNSEKSLAYLAVYKAGEAPNSPLMVEAVAHVRGKIKSSGYEPTANHFYEAAIDLSLLADMDAEKYQQDIKVIAGYLAKGQSPEGHWNYPAPHNEAERTGGDVSVTHYACLGLWAAARAEVEVDPQIWVRALNWAASHHNADGGYAYNPGVAIGLDGTNSTMNMTVNGVGIMCIAMLNLEPGWNPPFEKGANPTPKVAAGTPEKPASVIETVDLDQKAAEKAAQPVRIPEAAYNATRNALNWVSARFQPVNNSAAHRAYYYYSLERMGALANVTKLSGRDWYDECANQLLTDQKPDGSWGLTQIVSQGNDTSFCVLFLTRSTGKILKRVTPEGTVGGGLLSGGRGLPEDLSNVDAKGNVKKIKEKSSLDQLLAALNDPDSLAVGDTQSEFVEQIQLGDKSQLIGKKELLIQLVASPNPEVRQTAVWAIGRSGNLSLARYAVSALEDKDTAVMIEAHRALCWTARKPKAFKLPDDPLDGLPPDAGPDQQAAAVDAWRRQAVRLWGEWYLRNRPYAERGDEFETNLRNRLLELQ
ncbi:MAG: hypothetical protein DWH91_03325 [Planctomycetota bacterium]|nr:MAG: hypothetical protein DWH91_03325 [Planctomycetota bacterium]